ncbi:MAG: hypothetical protein EU530_01175 [Promethearchaeota archaeon]|nr:MAG: hypothetical protein EU530_01175 [Candidatus Lokiarchaeota archaeon]
MTGKYTDIRSYPTYLGSDQMTYDLDDWWQTPLGDSGMELHDLMVNGLTALRDKLKKEKRLNEKIRDAFKEIIKIMDAEYTKLTETV